MAHLTSDKAYCDATNVAMEAVRKNRGHRWNWDSKRGRQVHYDIMNAIDALDMAGLLIQDEEPNA